jgi:hypothetical protein
VTFDADLPHHFENPTAAEASFLAVVSAGLRRSSMAATRTPRQTPVGVPFQKMSSLHDEKDR